MIKIKKSWIKQLRWGGKQTDFHPVPDEPRLGIRCYPSGRKVWSLRYRLLGDRRGHLIKLERVGLREPSEVVLDAQVMLLAIDQGQNPKAIKKQATKKYTLADYSKHYLSLIKEKPSFREAEARIEKKLFPALGRETFLLHIMRDDVTAMHEDITEDHGKVEANRCVQLLRTMLNRAEKSVYLPDGTPNPCRGVDLNRETSRTRYLNEAELERLGEALGYESIDTQAKVDLILNFGLRKMEALSLRWSDVQLEDSDDFPAHINLEGTKSGRDHRLGLNEETTHIFAQLHKLRVVQKVRRDKRNKMAGSGLAISPYIFPSKFDLNAHVQDFKKPWHRIRKNAGIEDVTLHDLRRTAGTIMAQNGVALEVICSVLNHTNKEVTRIYAKMGDNQITDALALVSGVVVSKLGRIGERKTA